MTSRPAGPLRITYIAGPGKFAADAMRDGGITMDEVEAVFLVDPRFRVLDRAVWPAPS